MQIMWRVLREPARGDVVTLRCGGVLVGCIGCAQVIAPFLFGRVYALGSRRGRPGIAFVAAALSVVFAELTFRTLSKKDLGLLADSSAPQKPPAAQKKA
jgi:hypothetical protein